MVWNNPPLYQSQLQETMVTQQPASSEIDCWDSKLEVATDLVWFGLRRIRDRLCQTWVSEYAYSIFGQTTPVAEHKQTEESRVDTEVLVDMEETSNSVYLWEDLLFCTAVIN